MSEKKQRRSWTPDEKTEIVLAGLRGDHTLRDVCREHEISEPTDDRDGQRNTIHQPTFSEPSRRTRNRAPSRRLSGSRVAGVHRIMVRPVQKTGRLASRMGTIDQAAVSALRMGLSLAAWVRFYRRPMMATNGPRKARLTTAVRRTRAGDTHMRISFARVSPGRAFQRHGHAPGCLAGVLE